MKAQSRDEELAELRHRVQMLQGVLEAAPPRQQIQEQRYWSWLQIRDRVLKELGSPLTAALALLMLALAGCGMTAREMLPVAEGFRQGVLESQPPPFQGFKPLNTAPIYPAPRYRY